MASAGRAQAGMEMFITFSIALLFLFWFSNYLNMFSSSTGKIGVNQQQKLANKDLARLANDVCATGTNLTVKTPCLTLGSDSLYYQIYTGIDIPQTKLRLYNSFTNHNTSEAVNCVVETTIPESVRCSSSEKLCLYKYTANRVSIKRGACN